MCSYSGTNEIKWQIKLSVELSLHVGSLIDAEKKVHAVKGKKENLVLIHQVLDECRELVYCLLIFHTCCTSKSSVILIIHLIDDISTTTKR